MNNEVWEIKNSLLRFEYSTPYRHYCSLRNLVIDKGLCYADGNLCVHCLFYKINKQWDIMSACC